MVWHWHVVEMDMDTQEIAGTGIAIRIGIVHVKAI
jgi:hypothetical protein